MSGAGGKRTSGGYEEAMFLARPLLLSVAFALAACSPSKDNPAPMHSGTSAARSADHPQVASAKLACEHLAEPPRQHQQFDVGISPYEACLGDRANLTRPADRELCGLAKSTISAGGACILGE
jgi:hypothetical protein